MKLRIVDRLMIALSGLFTAAFAIAAGLETFLSLPITHYLQAFFAKRDPLTLSIIAIACVLVFCLGLYCLGVLFRHSQTKRGFVVQKTDTGELSISIRAIEGLVQKCVDQHDELKVLGTGLESDRDGLVIRLRIAMAGGVNIPLIVSSLQKQIRQYITACSGVDVREVKVQVETASVRLKDSPYVVQQQDQPLMAHEEPIPPMDAPNEQKKVKEEKRPLHQRLFGRKEEAMDVPPPPEAEVMQHPSEENHATQEDISTEPAHDETVNSDPVEDTASVHEADEKNQKEADSIEAP